MNEIKNVSVELIASTPDAEKVIERAGRTCYLSFEKADEESAGKFIKARIKTGHDSILEHACASFRIKGVSRAFTHQLVRHRMASYSQQSQRYVSENEFSYILPPSIEENPEAHKIYSDFMESSRLAYSRLREMNILKEDARFVLPNAVETEIVFTANFRELRHFFSIRLEKHAQWEIRRAAYEMLLIMKKIAPSVFADFIPAANWTAEFSGEA
ncbi:MAG TPA: FAD-dependent thymidylate synthase [Spirochaetota bacterium]|nr:FAD-dependent thymidylate synthase [Spirochaetota bacterium]